MVDRRRRRRLAGTVRALEQGGAAALELGFPFSDPIADGPTLEAAADRSLAAGTRWADLRAAVSVASARLPTAVMTYANPVWSRGVARALEELRAAGATGLIVPDLSFEESAPWRSAARRARLSLVLLAAPTASPARMRAIASASSGFLYLVSRFGITGRAPPTASRTLRPLVSEAHRAAPRLPVLVGFGIRDRSSARQALASGADGIVVGSALQEQLDGGASDSEVERWLRTLVPPSQPDKG